MLQKVLSGSRFLIVVAVIGSYLASAVLLIYGGLLQVKIIIGVIIHPDLSTNAGRLLALECIESIDVFLLGTAFYIVALGLYELFIERGAMVMPTWLQIHNLEDLKAKLLGVIIVVMTVYFLEQIITWDGKRDILGLGIAEALIIGVVTLSIYLNMSHQTKKMAEKAGPTNTQE
jgi:uncharacterized membrane protein YqhA